MEVLLLAVMGLGNIFCFLIGARVGQKVVKGETVEVPSVNPMKAIRERESRKEADRQQERLDIMMGNIDCYNGTAFGQKDVPGG